MHIIAYIRHKTNTYGGKIMNLEKIFLIFFGIVLCVASAVIYNERYAIINKMIGPQPEMEKVFIGTPLDIAFGHGDFKALGEARNRYNDRYKQWQNELDTFKVAIPIMSGVLFLLGLWIAISAFAKPKNSSK